MRLSMIEYFSNESQAVAVEPREPQMSFPRHDHEFDEIVIVRSGNGWHVVNDKPHFITCGELFYIKAKDHHEFDQVNELRLVNILYCLDRLSIRSDELYRLLCLSSHAVGEDGLHWQVTEDTLSQLDPLIAVLIKESRKTGFLSKTMAEALFLQLVVTLYRNRFPIDSDDMPAASRLGHVLSYLRHHFTQPIDLDELAERFGYSVRNFHRVFRGATGTTPHNYLMMVRINHAMRALSLTDDSITDIAFDSGFNDGNYFSYCFNKTAGGSPSAYRQTARNGRHESKLAVKKAESHMLPV